MASKKKTTDSTNKKSGDFSVISLLGRIGASGWFIVSVASVAYANYKLGLHWIWQALAIFACLCFYLRHYGEATFRDFAKITIYLACAFDRCSSFLEAIFASSNQRNGRDQNKRLSPIAAVEQPLLAEQEPLPKAFRLVIASGVALALFVLGYSGAHKPSHLPEVKRSAYVETSDFAKRFQVPNSCQGCGGVAEYTLETWHPEWYHDLAQLDGLRRAGELAEWPELGRAVTYVLIDDK